MQTLLMAIRFSLLMMILCGLAYPLAMTGLAQAVFPSQANGSLIYSPDGHLVGSKLIGQGFTQAKYFHPRPAANSYDASNSGGANLSVGNEKLLARIKTDLQMYQTENAVKRSVPVDAVTASASSLDPHISLDNALAQVPRVAHVRGLSVAGLTKKVEQSVEKAPLSESPYINVLELNLALDKESQPQTEK